MIIMGEETKKMMAETFVFAMENERRFTSLLTVMNYILNYANEGFPELTKVQMYSDRSCGNHGYTMVIEKKKWEQVKSGGCREVWTSIITMGMVYHSHTDGWGTHS